MIYTIANQKGGESKTTTAWTITTGATYRGRKALAVDLDSQSTLSFLMGGDPGKAGTYELITGQASALDIIQHTPGGDVITASYNLAAADTVLKDRQRVQGLRDALRVIKNKYDYIVIDTPPTIGTLLVNALTAADGVIIPMRAKMVSLQGLYLLAQTIRETQESYNKALDICGILLTQHSARTVAARNVSEAIRQAAADLDIYVFNSTIRAGVAIDEAQILRKSLFDYAPRSNPSIDYMKFLDELGI